MKRFPISISIGKAPIPSFSVEKALKRNENGKTRDPGTNSGAVRCQKAIIFRLWQKSVKIDGITPELQGFYRTFVGFGHQKRATPV